MRNSRASVFFISLILLFSAYATRQPCSALIKTSRTQKTQNQEKKQVTQTQINPLLEDNSDELTEPSKPSETNELTEPNTSQSAAPSQPKEIYKSKQIKNRPTVALALGGGGMRGAAHIGVLRVFKKEGIPVDYVAGCSMGAIVGGLYCAGISLDEIERILVDKSLQKAYAPGWVGARILLCPLKNFTCTCTFKDKPYAGIFSGSKFRGFLEKRLPEDKKRLEDLDTPFVAVCTNLIDGRAYKLAKGKLSEAILASSALPPIVRPVSIDGNLYVDGAVRSNVPVVSAKQFGADVVIAVSADAQLQKMKPRKFTSVKTVTLRVTDIIISVADKYHLQKADIAIEPNVTEIPILTKKTKYVEPAIKAGEEAAYAALPKIREALAKAQLKVTDNITNNITNN